jgi:hypothetical protein
MMMTIDTKLINTAHFVVMCAASEKEVEVVQLVMNFNRLVHHDHAAIP